MTKLYIPPPTYEDEAYKWMQAFIAGKRIKLSVTIDHLNGDNNTQSIDQRRYSAPHESKEG